MKPLKLKTKDIISITDLTAEEILSLDYRHVILATGACWRNDGVGVTNWQAVPGTDLAHVVSPQAVFTGADLTSPIVVFDDDKYYMGALIAEKLKLDGHQVTQITTTSEVSPWTHNTLEQHRVQARVLELGIKVITSQNIIKVDSDQVHTSCVYTERPDVVAASTVVLVTSRLPNNALHLELTENTDTLTRAGIESVIAIGDCLCPSTIAAAVHDGHRVAREMDAPPENPDMPFRRETILLEDPAQGIN
jgi:dimethylamine/trimethylamine dehydrogenase